MNPPDCPDQQSEREAFEKYRGEPPTIGYTRDISSWHIETEKLWQCWQAACNWKDSPGQSGKEGK